MFIRTVFISLLVCLTFQLNSVFWADLSRNNPIHIIGLGKYVVLADGGLYNAYEQKNIESFVYSATSTNTKTYVVGEYGVYIFENKLSFIEISFYPNPYRRILSMSKLSIQYLKHLVIRLSFYLNFQRLIKLK